MIKSKGVYQNHLKKLKCKIIKKCRKELDYNRAVFFMMGFILGVIVCGIAKIASEN
jgi:hypothetical protein